MRIEQAGLLGRSFVDGGAQGEAAAATGRATVARTASLPIECYAPAELRQPAKLQRPDVLAAGVLIDARGEEGLLGHLSLKLQAQLQRVQEQGLQRQAGLQGPGALSGSLKNKLQTLRDQVALAPVLADVKQKLQAQAADAKAFNTVLRQAFGDRFDAGKAETLRQQVMAGDFSWMPKIQVVSQKSLRDLSGVQGAGVGLGAYAAGSDTIYLSRELLRDSAQASRTLLEEIGHGIDARTNTQDAAGDEGEIFGRLVSGETLDAQTLQALKSDNDRGAVRIGGRVQDVEYGFLKKALKKISGAIKKGVSKIGKAVVHGVVNTFKATLKVTVGLATFDFNRVKQGFGDGVNATTTSVKQVHEAAKDTVKEVHAAAKTVFKKLMQSKIFAAVLMVCRFIPFPPLQLAVTIIDAVRAAYMTYQGIKNKSIAAIIDGVASLATGASNVASDFGASASFVNSLTSVADAASKLSMAYSAVANKDFDAALGLLGQTGAVKDNAMFARFGKVGEYAAQGLAIRQAVRNDDVLGALGTAVGVAGTKSSGKLAAVLQDTREVVNATRAAQALKRGDLEQAQTLTSNLRWVQQAGTKADAIVASRRAAMQQAAQLKPAQTVQTQGVPNQAEIVISDVSPPGPRTLDVRRGQTLESIAKAQYGENWRAGLAQLLTDNRVQFNQWDTPVLREGQSLVINDLSGKSPQELDRLARTGGRVIADNANQLRAKAELEQRAPAAAKAKIDAAAQEAQTVVASTLAGQVRPAAVETVTVTASRNPSALSLAGEAFTNYWNGTQHTIESTGQWVVEKAGVLKKDYNELQRRVRADATQRGGVLGDVEKNVIDTVDAAAGFVMGASDAVAGVSKLVYHAGQLINPIEWMVNPEANQSRAETTGQVLNALRSAQGWKNLWDGATHGYREGNVPQGVGRAIFEIGTLFLGVGQARIVSQAATAAGKAGATGTRLLYSSDDVARAMGTLDAATAAYRTSDLARLTLIEERAGAVAGRGAGSVGGSTAASYAGAVNVAKAGAGDALQAVTRFMTDGIKAMLPKSGRETGGGLDELAGGAAGKVADTARATEALQFDSSGWAHRSDATPVYNQNFVMSNGQTMAPVACGPFSGAMILKTLGKDAEAMDLLTRANVLSPDGMSPAELVSTLRLAGLNAVYKRGLSVQDMADATAKGYPAVAIVSRPDLARSHYVVVDYATVKTEVKVLDDMSLKNEGPVSVLAIRDSAGGKRYFEKVSSFESRFRMEGGEAVVIEGLLSHAAVARQRSSEAITIIRDVRGRPVAGSADEISDLSGMVRGSEVPAVVKGGSSQPSPFDKAGRMPRDDAPDVMYQVDGPYKAEDACGALACAMVLKSMGKDGAAHDLRVIADAVSPNGLPLEAYVSFLRQGGLDAVYKTGLSMEELAAATKTGPVMVGVWSTPEHGHGIVVDYVTTRPNNIRSWVTGKYEEVPVFAIRDPGNPPYFQKVSEFDKWFHVQGREAIVVDGTLSDVAVAAEATRVRLAQHLAEAERRLGDAAAAAEKTRDLTDAMKLKGAPIGSVAGTVGETSSGAANVVKSGADRGSNLPGKTERVEPPLFDTSTDITDFNPLGLLPRHDSRAVFGLAGAPAACTSVACAMALDTIGKRAAAADMLTLADAAAPEGMYFEELGSWLRQAGVDATYKRDVSLQDIANATETGNPALVTVWQGDATSVHATVVDAVTTRHGIPVVAIRDPWGYQYFEKASDFEGRLAAGRGEAFFINGLLSGSADEAGLAIGVGEDGLGPLTKPTNWGLVPESWGRGRASIADSGASITKASGQRVIAKTEPVDAADIEAASVLAQRIDDLANRLLTTPLSEPIAFNGGTGRTTFYGGGWGTRELRQMPEGTSLTFYSPNGALIDSFLADSVVADRVMHAGKGGYLDLTGDLSFLPTTTIKPGQFFEDRILLNPRRHPLWGSVEIPPLAQNGRFTLEPRTRVSDLVELQMPHVVKGTLVTVDQPMRLSDLLKPGMGDCHWAACSTRPGMPDSGTLWSVGGVMTLDAKDTSYLVRHSRQTAGEATNKTPAAVPLEIETALSPEELRLNAAEPVLPPVVVFGANGDLGKTAVTTFTSQGVPTIAYVRRNPDGTTRPYAFPFEVRGTSIQGLVNADTPNLIVVHDLDRIPSGARVFAPLKSQSFIDAFKGNTMSDAASKRHIYVIANGTREIEGDLARTYPGVIYDRMISDVAASTSNNGTLLVTNSKPLHVQASEANRVLTSIFGEQPFMVLNQTTDMNSVVGQKLVLNTSVNGPAVMLQSTMGELVAAHPEFMRAIIGEGYRVVTASGGRWPAASLKPLDAFTDNYINLFKTTYAPHPTSMGIDFAKGNALENHYINHGMSRLGREVGVPTPLNDLVARWVDKFEATRRNYPKDADVGGPGLLLFREREQAMIQQAVAEMRQLVERLR